ncbi:hypothetical protein BGZ50_006456 [Haplosporangium sp. Z 11]|nr:hypothetical protein BGZ50_006456 [Haplosporangium sp. Z 11]
MPSNFDIPEITVSEAASIGGQENGLAITASAKSLKPKSRTFICEQRLLDEIVADFGPHLVELSIKQDFFCKLSKSCGQSSPDFLTVPDPSVTTVIPFVSGPSIQLVASAQVPKHIPRAILNQSSQIFHSLHLPWLREIKILFRATADEPFFLFGSKACNLSSSAPLMLTPATIPRTVDFSLCETLEKIWIEDLDHVGRPHVLRQQKQRRRDDNIELFPFDQYQGVLLPARLKSLTIIGLSAAKFNFGWLRETPHLEYLCILGIQTHPVADDIQEDTAAWGGVTSETCGSFWQWQDVSLLRLRYLTIHHSPTHHFRFGILQHCPRLESLDIRGVPLHAIRLYEENVKFFSNVEQQKCSNVACCRLEALPVHEASRENFLQQLGKVLESFLPNVVQLHLDGIPISWLIELTTGPPSSPAHRSTLVKAVKLPRLECVLTSENMGARDVVQYDLVPCQRELTENIQLSTITFPSKVFQNGVIYVIQKKYWQRLIACAPSSTALQGSTEC